MKMMIKSPLISEVWMLIFNTVILSCCCHCHTTDVNFNNSVGSGVRPHSAESPTSLSSINCSSQDSRRTKPTATAGVLTQSASSSTRYVAVFDIDWVLCCLLSPCRRRASRFFAMNLTECQHIWFTWEGEPFLHIFLPHLQILFNYLLEHGVRIAFASRGKTDRNLRVIPELLRSFWGNEKYKALKLKGQFRIHSQDDMRMGKASGEGDYVKDLQLIIQDGELLSNAVLIEDDPSYCAHDQKPVVLVGEFNQYKTCKDYNPLNNVYYLLGLFKTYFENKKYKTLPLRTAMSKILCKNHTDSCCVESNARVKGDPPFTSDFHELHPFVREMVDVGFAAVQELVPHATLYEKSKKRIIPRKR